MDTRQHKQQKYRELLSLATAIGVLLTSAASATLAQTPPGPPTHGPIDQQTLQLTPAQSAKFTQFENDSREKKHRLVDQIRALRKELWTVYQSYDIDVKRARDLNRRINHTQQDLLNLHLDEQVQLRKLLTPEQFARLQAAIRQHGGGQPPTDWHGSHGGPE